LVVDDDENLLHGLVRMLRQQPYRIYTAKSADEAIWILKCQEIDVLLTDEKMPGRTGTELLAWAAEFYPDLMRIMLTGVPTVETAVRAINEGGVYRFFTKPCNDVELAIAIRMAMEERDRRRRDHRLLESAAQNAPLPEPCLEG
jgi:DNA-binding NtrC family response regulator